MRRSFAISLLVCACGHARLPAADGGGPSRPVVDASTAISPPADGGQRDDAAADGGGALAPHGGEGGLHAFGGSGGATSQPAADGGGPTSCAASAAGDVPTGKDSFVANSGKQAVTSLTYTNVGASGMYAQVVSGWSQATGCVSDSDGSLCKDQYRSPTSVSGALAPFDDEMSFVFAGPIELYQLAVYQPEGGAWTRSAYWDRCRSDGLAFAGNKSWYECGGFVESYVTPDGTMESAAAMQFAGSIAAGTEVNVMSDRLCSGSGANSDCGWSSGLALHGFKGDAAGSKIFAVKLRMPIGEQTPAYWILPSQVIRSSQYGCNCRGAGSDATYKGGCGELDVAEVLGGVTTSLEATTTLYSFQDITGGGSVALERPVNESAIVLAIFDAPSRQIAIRRLDVGTLAFASTLTADAVAGWLADQGTVRALK
jgi:hypothetical protein